ncbi:MAG: methyltransferase type 11, partial [Trichodesmium sp.]
ISGQLTDPQETSTEHYQEKLVKLEGTAHCFSYGFELQQVTTRVDRELLDIPEEVVVFISGANCYKTIPELIDSWVKIIAAVPNSILLLLPFGPNWTSNYPKAAYIKHLKASFLKQGVAIDRLIVLDPKPVPNREDVKEYLKIADIYLDSYPFSGTTSLIEPLQVGLPVVAKQGNCFRGAMGAAILQSLGVSNLVADSEDSYIQLAISLGTNSELRKEMGNQIRQKMSAKPSFLDSQAYSQKIGGLFQKLLQNYLADRLSESLSLRDINLIIFPDWSCEEEELYQDFARVLIAIASHPDKGRINLLVDTSNISEEDADMALSSMVMNLMMEQEFDVEEGPDISLVGELSQIQWEVLLTLIKGKIVLENENGEAIAKLGAYEIPIFQIHQ